MLPLIAVRPQAFFMIPDWRWPLARIPVALVWLYEGLWGKVLGGHPELPAMAAQFPGLGEKSAAAALLLLGALECGLALWVLWGVRPLQAAFVQTLLLTAISAAGLLWAAPGIERPGQMLVMNLAFLTLAWLVAAGGGERERKTASQGKARKGSWEARWEEGFAASSPSASKERPHALAQTSSF